MSYLAVTVGGALFSATTVLVSQELCYHEYCTLYHCLDVPLTQSRMKVLPAAVCLKENPRSILVTTISFPYRYLANDSQWRSSPAASVVLHWSITTCHRCGWTTRYSSCWRQSVEKRGQGGPLTDRRGGVCKYHTGYSRGSLSSDGFTTTQSGIYNNIISTCRLHVNLEIRSSVSFFTFNPHLIVSHRVHEEPASIASPTASLLRQRQVVKPRTTSSVSLSLCSHCWHESSMSHTT